MICQSESLDTASLSDVNHCPICASASFSVVGPRKSIHPRAVTTFQIRSCSSCHHWFTSPTPTQAYLSQLYSEGSMSVLGRGWEEGTARSFNATASTQEESCDNWVLRDARCLAPAKYLEIGPGDGSLLRAFKALGWECFAVEPGSWARQQMNIFKDVAELPAGLAFRMIVANDVLEHMSDPAASFSCYARKLERGGRFYSSFPNAESFRARYGKTHWRMVRPLGHLHYFSRQSIEKLLRDNNLSAMRIDNYDKLSSGALGRLFGQLLQLDFRKTARALVDSLDLTVSALLEKCRSGDQWRVIAIRD